MGFAPQMFTSDKKSWTTPAFVLDRVRLIAPIGLDPADNEASLTNPRVSLRLPDNDGLAVSWKSLLLPGEQVFVNWPYGTAENKVWSNKAAIEAQSGVEMTCLVAVRTSENWWDTMLAAGPTAFGFFHKRLRFSNAKHSATFSSVVMYFGDHLARFNEAFKDVCAIWTYPRRGQYPLGVMRQGSPTSGGQRRTPRLAGDVHTGLRKRQSKQEELIAIAQQVRLMLGGPYG